MKKVFFILGNSGAGKDTAADYLEREYNFFRLHPIADWKRFLEEHFCLDYRDLDCPEIKNSLIPGSEITYNQYMVDHYHYCQEKNIPFSLPFVRRASSLALRTGEDIVSVATRNQHEIDELLYQVDRWGATTTLIVIERRGSEGLSSDDRLEELRSFLVSQCNFSHLIQNNGSISQLHEKIDAIYKQSNRVELNAQ